MGLACKSKKCIYHIAKNVIDQKDLCFSKYSSIKEAFSKEPSLVEYVGKSPLVILRKDNMLYELNTAGAIIWESLKNGQDLSSIVSELSKLFSFGGNNMSKEVFSFIEELKKYGFIY